MNVVYDSGMLVAADKNNRGAWALHEQLLKRVDRPLVPAGVLAQAWRGGPQHGLSRLLKGCKIVEFAEADARAVGNALATSTTSDVEDAACVLVASPRGIVVTSDRGDVHRIVKAHPQWAIDILDV